MARVTIEDCVEHLDNRFLLVHAAVRRTRQLIEGSKALVPIRNRQTVIALREIAAGKIRVAAKVSKLDVPESPPLAKDEEEALVEAVISEINLDEMAASKDEGEQGDAVPEQGENAGEAEPNQKEAKEG